MPDKDKVIKGLECHAKGARGCPYENENGCQLLLCSDALALLKEQEAEPEIEGGGSTWFYVCSECHGAIDNNDRFCKHCGARLKRTVK